MTLQKRVNELAPALIRRSADEKIEQALRAIQEIYASGKPVTKSEVCKLIHVHPFNITARSNPRLAHIIQEAIRNSRQIAQERRQEYETGLLQKVEDAACFLENSKQRVTLNAISKVVGISVAGLNYYPSIQAFLDPIAQKNRHGNNKRIRDVR